MSPTPEDMRRDTEKPTDFNPAVDQGEEFFIAEGAGKTSACGARTRSAHTDDAPGVLALIDMRSDSYERRKAQVS